VIGFIGYHAGALELDSMAVFAFNTYVQRFDTNKTFLGNYNFSLILTVSKTMARKDIYHDTVKRALIKDGWTITHDQFTFSIGQKDVFADLGAEPIIGADNGLRKIIVEIKSFIGSEGVKDLEQAIGQYTLYFRIIRKLKLNRLLYL